MKLLDEWRLVLCGWCFTIMFYLAPDNPEGIRILRIIQNWANKERLLR